MVFATISKIFIVSLNIDRSGMENLASNTLLKQCWGAYASLSFALASCMLYDSNWAWMRMFGVANENKHAASAICYTSALLGEGSLQLIAYLNPQHSAACLAYMIPYKLTSVFLLLKESTTTSSKTQCDALRFVAISYFAAASILVACCYVGRKE